jgi:hypothetical protein
VGVLGFTVPRGKSLFRTATDRISLTLLEPRSFRSGNVLLRYQPAGR